MRERERCGESCARWLNKFKRCPRGAVSAAAFVDTCSLFLPKESHDMSSCFRCNRTGAKVCDGSCGVCGKDCPGYEDKDT
jgi:hypothetical protein